MTIRHCDAVVCLEFESVMAAGAEWGWREGMRADRSQPS
jgi:hypothetical protein